ncbi:MAG: FISUMP domain-containing protein [Bacteroidetes bacterium]|nr:FISUMP domain-containing protein [Bacteroidota bacterium]
MRWIFLAPFVVLSSFCLGQVPDYVPQNGLIAWYPFNGNADDESGNGNDGENLGAFPVADRNGESNSAYGFGGGAKIHLQSLESIDWGYTPLTLSAWAHHEGQSDVNAVIVRYDDCVSSYVWGVTIQDYGNDLVCYDHNRFQTNHDIVVNPFTPSGWTHYVFVKDPDNGINKVYVNGELLETVSFASPLSPSGEGSPQLYVGSCGGWAHGFVGSIDDIAFFDRSLTDDEIEILYNGILPVLGCTNLQACNYNEVANEDDGSCEFVSCHCLDGTIWSDELGGCIPATTCPQDLDYDGVVGVNDLMNLLSAFGTPCDPPVAELTCGDPVSYHGYDYETVLIGEQCWFAENLRTELYQNGDSIITNLNNDEWSQTLIGSLAQYANNEANSMVYGLLYNWYAVEDERKLCPVEWHVATDGEITIMEIELGMSESEVNNFGARGTEGIGTILKSSPDDNPPWDGTNETGFSSLPSGYRHEGGWFAYAGSRFYLWSSSSINLQQAYHRQINSSIVTRGVAPKNIGFSVRCVKD